MHSFTKGRSSDSSFFALSSFPVSQWLCSCIKIRLHSYSGGTVWDFHPFPYYPVENTGTFCNYIFALAENNRFSHSTLGKGGCQYFFSITLSKYSLPIIKSSLNSSANSAAIFFLCSQILIALGVTIELGSGLLELSMICV